MKIINRPILLAGQLLCSFEDGLTLIEVLIAMVVFSIGILAVASMQVVSMDAISTGRMFSLNSAAAASYVEMLLLLPYNDSALSDSDDAFDPETPDHGPIAIDDGRATVQWEIDDDFPIPGTKRIKITVRQPTKNSGVRITTLDYVKAGDFR